MKPDQYSFGDIEEVVGWKGWCRLCGQFFIALENQSQSKELLEKHLLSEHKIAPNTNLNILIIEKERKPE
jgi:hypothetical protein